MRSKEEIKVAKKIMRCLFILTLLMAFAGLPSAFAAKTANILVYQVKYAPEHLATPMDWYNSPYFNNPDYKENRFVQYWTEKPIAPGGPRDTGFYAVYNEEGLSIFFQSNEPDRDANGVLLNSQIEFYLQTGLDNVPYHQVILNTNDSPAEYYEWQTEYRHDRPLEGNVTIVNQELPTGWGTVIQVPWDVYYEYVPLNGEDWLYSMIRWAPAGLSPTLGGHVHQVGRFDKLDFQAPTPEVRTAIQKNVIRKAWASFNATASQLQTTYLDGNTYNASFYHRYLQPLLTKDQAYGSRMAELDIMSPAEIEELYAHIGSWFGLQYDVEELRIKQNRDAMFVQNQPPTVSDATYSTLVDTPVSRVVVGTDPDGDTLTYSLGAAPAHGTADVSDDGHWSYTPNLGYAGLDSFKVLVSDTSGSTAVSTVNIVVTHGPKTTVTFNPEEPSGSNGWFTSDITVTLTTTDEEIGVGRTEYRIDGGDWNVYSSPFTLADEGRHVVEYHGIDKDGNAEMVHAAQVLLDKTAPTIDVALDRTELQSVNHKMVPITSILTYNDATSGIASVQLTSITSDETDNGVGDGNTANDIQNAEYGTEDTSFSLRAERSGTGEGRTYTITYTVMDQAGLTATGVATVKVPKDK
jgi:hypothetical protein